MRIVEDYKNNKILFKLNRHEILFKKAINKGLHNGGSEVVKEIRRIIRTGSRTGRVYYFRGSTYQASAPGEPPAMRSGKLVRSSKYEVRGYYEMEAGETRDYAKYLEKGTKNSDGKIKMEPRPHVIVAVKNKMIDVMNAVSSNINKEIGI